MKTIAIALVLFALGYRAEAQLITNQPARYPYKVEWFEKANAGISGKGIYPMPDAIIPGNSWEDTCTSTNHEFDLKGTFLGRNQGEDVYQFTLTRTQSGTSTQTVSSFKDIQFDGKQVVVFDDLFYKVIMKSPDPGEVVSK